MMMQEACLSLWQAQNCIHGYVGAERENRKYSKNLVVIFRKRSQVLFLFLFLFFKIVYVASLPNLFYDN